MNPIETYLNNLYQIYSTGAGVKETSYYGALETLLNDIGKTLKPAVRCVINLKNQGAGIPDGGLFSAHQFTKKKGQDQTPFETVFPERGVIEIKSTQEDVIKIANSDQVKKYWQKYRQVLVTNYRDFLLLGEDLNGHILEIERFTLAENDQDFWLKTVNYRQFALEKGDSFTEYLKRVMLQQASINSPADLAWFLASYAREAKFCIEKIDDFPVFLKIKSALEGALGIKFTGKKGDSFFQSTLIQTLFYGIFSAWVLYSRENSFDPPQPPLEKGENRKNNLSQSPPFEARLGGNNLSKSPPFEGGLGGIKYFNWKESAYYLHVPMIQSLFYQLADPRQLRKMGLIDILDRTGAVLNRVKKDEFFNQFNEGEAVQYFYEPFLEAFDPNLRKELGVWYTPPEIVKYMVQRVDTVLKTELNIKDGLADDQVFILDPCCGTGAYLVEVLRQIADSLKQKGLGALAMSKVKESAIKRIFGFEILTAPFVISHLQLGLVLANLGVPLQEETERVGVFLTNALTGWQPPTEEAKQRIEQLELALPGIVQEKEAADQVKRGQPILVILGNPPYNAYAGTSPTEENDLVEVYKEGLIKNWGIKKFNLDDLYIRFFRLAEKCISDNGKNQGVVCFISNHSWVSDPSFVVLRQHLLQSFDKFWLENMHGNRKISEYAPDGKTSETVFAIKGFSAGIQQGVVISLWVKNNQQKLPQVLFRDDINKAKAVERRQELLDSLNKENFDSYYEIVNPTEDNRFSFRPSDIADHYLQWVKLTDLCLQPPFVGLEECRGGALIDIDKEALEKRMKIYYDSSIDWEQLKIFNTSLTKDMARFNAKEARKKIINHETFNNEQLQSYLIRPFEYRWCYYSYTRPLWNEPRPTLSEQCWEGNQFLISRFNTQARIEGKPMYFSSGLFDKQTINRNPAAFPIFLRSNSNQKSTKKTKQLFDTEEFTDNTIKANLSEKARAYLSEIGINNPDENKEKASLIWYHALAIGYSPQYLTENADGIRQDFPRIPLPNSQKLLLKSAKLGEQIAQLLDTENNNILSLQKLNQIGVISHVENKQLNPDRGDLIINVGWGHGGKAGVTMPGKGKLIERNYNKEELELFKNNFKLTEKQVKQLLGKTTCDVFLNDIAYWKNIPIKVWEYTIGGYQVIKKWLSYREEKLLGRALKIEEVLEVSNIAKRITAILLLEPELNDNYVIIKDCCYNWK